MKKIAIININEKLKGIIKEINKLDDYEVTLIIPNKEILDNNPSWYPESIHNIKIIFINPKDKKVLEIIKGFDSVVVLRDEDINCDAETALVTVAIEEANKKIHTVAEVYSSINKYHIETLNIDEIICIGEVSEKMIAQGAITSKIDGFFNYLLKIEKGSAEVFIKSLPEEYFNEKTRYFDILKLFLEKNIKLIPIGYINLTPKANRLIREYKINPKTTEDKERILSKNTEIIFIGMKENLDL